MIESTIASEAITQQKDSSAAVSTPAPEKPPQYNPKIITSLDCKLLQYEYGIYKLEKFIASLKRLHSSTTEIPLIHYIVLLTGSVFAINDKAFDSRFDKLSNFKPIQIGTVNIATNVSHILYDIPDLPVSALDDFPSFENTLKCLKQVETLSNICLSGYKKRLESAKTDKANVLKGTNLETYYSKLELIISHDIFHQDVDLQLDNVSFPLTDEEQTNIQHYEEASLIDMDLKELFVIVQQMEKSLTKLKPVIDLLKKPQANDSYAVHKVFLLTSRLNEIYTIIRRFGRKIYLSNHQHLVDSKFLYHCPNAAYFKTNILKNMDDYYNSMKKNGTLIANITRLIRQDTKLEINAKNVSTHINFVIQGLNVTEKSLSVLKEFGLTWIVTERKFRNVYNLPRDNLDKIYESIPELKPKPPQAKATPKTQQPQATRPNNLQTSAMERHLKTLDLNDNGGGRRSRSSSTSSVNSNGSNSSAPPSGLMRRGSLTSPNKGLGNSRVSSPRSRPNSMLFQQQQHCSSNSSLENGSTAEGKATSTKAGAGAQAASVQGRRRSNSHPLANETVATSGAAAALKANGVKTSSPYKQQQRRQQEQAQQKQQQQQKTQHQQSPPVVESNTQAVNGEVQNSHSSLTKKLIAVSEEVTEEAVPSIIKRSASQRLQQHIRDAARSGDLRTTQRETFNSVVYDPNHTSDLNMKRYVERSKVGESQSPEPTLSPPPSSAVPAAAAANTISNQSYIKGYGQPVPRTRDQVTRSNTQRNSFIPEFPPKASLDSQPVSQDNSSNSTATSSSTLGSSVDQTSQTTPSTTSVTTPVTDQSQTTAETISQFDDQNTLIVGSSNEATTTTAEAATPVIKKVRFTGVPEYTAAEDAPTKYSHAILRNFAVFRSPSKANKERAHYFTKSDQLLKEESLSFRANQALNEGELVLPSQVMPPPPTVTTTKRGLGLSKFRFKSS
ncbi:Gip4 protein [Candida orthopsilosis Co 90-125]|uniref:Gip4 protein n=1 Tax=Candida orthopsilosis (strain 90-125) TaxID=1136231 RepID=H8WVR3_CANO9|nr:Gip4 protein [Candida orthopsilosis Co 90-125]CCG20536.1 Gip4 protein [Candida orthopsilosis Co 90-125]